MGQKTWPAFKSCKHQCYGAKDRLSRLPDEILMLIMSFLTMKEAARTSVASRRLNYMWRCFPVLVFEDPSAMTRIFEDRKCIPQERSSFVRWVNRVVEAHVGQVIDEFRVSFVLDTSFQSDFDKWIVFALAKQVKILELNFIPRCRGWDPSHLEWRISVDQPQNLGVFKSCLSSLRLKFVYVTAKDIEFLLLSCSVLENLCIEFSPSLTHITVFDSPIQLKHLEVSRCRYLRSIDILAPKLLSFTHHGDPIELHIRNASLLSEVLVGDIEYRGEAVAFAFDPLSKYSLQLEYLSWRMRLCGGGIHNYDKFNLRINNPPAMTNLKHLELHVYAMCEQSLLGWADFIEACPILQRITVKFTGKFGRAHIRRKIEKRNGRPLKSLKTLDFYGHLGLPMELEFMTYVVENSIMLKDVIVELRPLSQSLSTYISAEDHNLELEKLEKILPQGVNLHYV